MKTEAGVRRSGSVWKRINEFFLKKLRSRYVLKAYPYIYTHIYTYVRIL